MKTVDCQHCEKTGISVNDTIKVDGEIYCQQCFEKTFTEEAQLDGKALEKEFDPSTCTTCNKDFGETALETIAGRPTCEPCQAIMRERSFPTWVKAFFAGVLLLVVFSIVYNWRFYAAYKDMQGLQKAVEVSDYNRAYQYSLSASENIPELPYLKSLVPYFQGIILLQKDSSAAALSAFSGCSPDMPAVYGLNDLMRQARIGVAFDKQDYDGYLSEALAMHAEHPGEPSFLVMIASAYACKYATTMTNESKEQAMQYLDLARAAPDKTGEIAKYINRVEYRLFTREIINNKEFEKRFPQGWTKPQS